MNEIRVTGAKIAANLTTDSLFDSLSVCLVHSHRIGCAKVLLRQQVAAVRSAAVCSPFRNGRAIVLPQLTLRKWFSAYTGNRICVNAVYAQRYIGVAGAGVEETITYSPRVSVPGMHTGSVCQ